MCTTSCLVVLRYGIIYIYIYRSHGSQEASCVQEDQGKTLYSLKTLYSCDNLQLFGTKLGNYWKSNIHHHHHHHFINKFIPYIHNAISIYKQQAANSKLNTVLCIHITVESTINSMSTNSISYIEAQEVVDNIRASASASTGFESLSR